MARKAQPVEDREDSMEKLGVMLGEFMMAAQSGNRLETPDFEGLLAEFPGIELQEIQDAFLAAGVLSDGASKLSERRRPHELFPTAPR
ncbi:hypothetical protein [Planctomycetes bacterium TBK1r]|uniref:Uncharacterized protein n=1 Tax=Stieleria magnilauensis TaxID=2527963 RepID=A0ABX5XGX7_9BACT|nr:hypothetical protein TBK1r_01530 [Planctomycetes bacterium TBK1r]